MDYRIFNVHTDVNAHNCTQEVYEHHKRVCTESWFWEKNPLPHQGIKPASWYASLMLYQQSYISVPNLQSEVLTNKTHEFIDV